MSTMFIKLYYQPRPRSASRDRVTACQTYIRNVRFRVAESPHFFVALPIPKTHRLPHDALGA